MSQQKFNFERVETVHINPPAHPEQAFFEPRGEGITVKFSPEEKEEIRALSYSENTGMSTMIYEAWQFYKEFKHVKSIMLRFKNILITTAITLDKELK